MRTFVASTSLLLMALCTLARSAPTLPSSDADTVTSTSEPIMDTTVLEKSPVTTTTTTTTMTTAESTELPVTTADANLIAASATVADVTTTTTESAGADKATEIHEEPSTAAPLARTSTHESQQHSTIDQAAATATTTTTTTASVKATTAARPQPLEPSDGKSSEKKKLSKFKDADAKKSWSAKDRSKLKLANYVDAGTAPPPTTTTTTEAATNAPTSIKTAPTTLKATTLTSTTPSPPTTTTTTTTTTTMSSGDGVIVLNSNSSGLIVVDVMDGFGKANATQSNFEIKLDLIEDEIFTTTTTTTTTTVAPPVTAAVAPPSQTTKSGMGGVDAVEKSDDLILVSDSEATATAAAATASIKWNKMQTSGDIKITFDNIDLPRQNVNVSIENGELVIDSIDISVLNRVEEELRLNATAESSRAGNSSLEIVLVEEAATSTTAAAAAAAERKLANDDIKIQTTDKDSDTVFYISNTEVKLVESIPTASPNETAQQPRRPAIYEEDVIVDVPATAAVLRNHSSAAPPPPPPSVDKYEEDIVLSPLTSDFDPKDINYIGEAFLDVEESANGGGVGENRHIIPLTSDVVVQPVELKDMPSINVPIIGEPPQIELAEMMFSDDYDARQTGGGGGSFPMDEFSPFLISRLTKSEAQAEEPRSEPLDTGAGVNGTLAAAANKTHSISVNTVNVNGTNATAALEATAAAAPTIAPANLTAAAPLAVDGDDVDNSEVYDVQTLLVACLATLAPLFLCVIIAFVIRYCWQKHRRNGVGSDLISDKSTDPLAEKSADDLKSTESAMTLNRGNGNLQTQSTELLLANANGDVTPNGCNHSDTNGSIIKMTMKNNHLIVETEERNDISRDTRETKMHYSPSEKDGVFIVEAARGADQNGSHKPSPQQQKSAAKEDALEIPDEIKIDTLQSHFTPSSPEEERKHSKQAEQVEVHTPPAEMVKTCNGAKTGLSQSDLSLTSSNSSNQNYTYGDRDAYQCEDKGYRGSSPKRVINVHCHDLKPLIENSPPAPAAAVAATTAAPPPNSSDDGGKPVITSAIYKNDSQDDNQSLKSDRQATVNGCNEVITNGINRAAAAAAAATATPPKAATKINGIISAPLKNGIDDIAVAMPEENGDVTMDSLSFLPAPPPVDEPTSSELMSMDSFPPPPPLDGDAATAVLQS